MPELAAQCESVQDGHMGRMEAMLVAQAHTLDAIFNRLAAHASAHVGDRVDLTAGYLKLALRAQSQCRANIEAVTLMKNPPVVFAKQANFAAGHQQVNNGVAAQVTSGAQAHVHENEKPQNELLEAPHGERLDPREAGATVRRHSPLEAVGERPRT